MKLFLLVFLFSWTIVPNVVIMDPSSHVMVLFNESQGVSSLLLWLIIGDQVQEESNPL